MEEQHESILPQTQINLALEQLERSVRLKNKTAIGVIYDFAQANIDWEKSSDEDFKKWDALVTKANDILYA